MKLLSRERVGVTDALSDRNEVEVEVQDMKERWLTEESENGQRERESYDWVSQ
jgi:hypothetical protein